MQYTQEILDLSSLPRQLQTELLDFYEFLSQKYGLRINAGEGKNKPRRFIKFLSNPIYVAEQIQYTREELHERWHN